MTNECPITQDLDQQLPSISELTSLQVVNRGEDVGQLQNNYIGINNLYHEMRRMNKVDSSTKYTLKKVFFVYSEKVTGKRQNLQWRN